MKPGTITKIDKGNTATSKTIDKVGSREHGLENLHFH